MLNKLQGCRVTTAGLNNRGNAVNMFPATYKFWKPFLAGLVNGPASQMLTSQPIRLFRLDAGQMAVRPPENLKSQEHLDSINIWTKNQKMKINQSKTKTMIFNHTNNFQFNTRLNIDNQILETVNQTKLS